MTMNEIKLAYMKQVFNNTKSRSEAAKILGISVKSAEKYYNELLGESPKKTLHQLEIETILKTYRENGFSQIKTAKILGLSPSKVHQFITKFYKTQSEVSNEKQNALHSGVTGSIPQKGSTRFSPWSR